MESTLTQQSPQKKPLPQLVRANYQSLGNIKLSFRILHDFVAQIKNLQLILPAETKLLELKKKIDQLSKKNFLFYLKDSFMPSLNSRIGDLAQCYGRYDERQNIFQLHFTISELKDEFG